MHHFEEERVETRYMFSITSYRKGVLLTCIVFCDRLIAFQLALHWKRVFIVIQSLVIVEFPVTHLRDLYVKNTNYLVK